MKMIEEASNICYVTKQVNKKMNKKINSPKEYSNKDVHRFWDTYKICTQSNK